jgi:hypothetical protein
LWFLYTKRGIRIELPTAISVQQDPDTTSFLGDAGRVVARVANEDVWLHTDHDPLEEPQLPDPDD